MKDYIVRENPKHVITHADLNLTKNGFSILIDSIRKDDYNACLSTILDKSHYRREYLYNPLSIIPIIIFIAYNEGKLCLIEKLIDFDANFNTEFQDRKFFGTNVSIIYTKLIRLWDCFHVGFVYDSKLIWNPGKSYPHVFYTYLMYIANKLLDLARNFVEILAMHPIDTDSYQYKYLLQCTNVGRLGMLHLYIESCPPDDPYHGIVVCIKETYETLKNYKCIKNDSLL